MSINSISGSTYYSQIASGNRINSAADDAAGSAIAEKMQSEINELNVSTQNASAGQGLINVADGALANINDALQRIRELSVQAGNASIYGAEGLGMIQDEINQLKESIQEIAKNTEYNTMKLLDGSQDGWQIASGGNGTYVNGINATLEALGIADYDVTGSFDIRKIDSAISMVSKARSSMGAKSNGLDHQIAYNEYAALNLTAAQSTIKDTDMAEAIMGLKKEQNLQQYQMIMLKKKMENEQNGKMKLFEGIM